MSFPVEFPNNKPLDFGISFRNRVIISPWCNTPSNKRKMMRLLLCGALLSVAIAMFADQAGVDDRSNVNIGPVRHAAASGRNLVVSTDAGMVAAINQRTGEAVWRIAVADGMFCTYFAASSIDSLPAYTPTRQCHEH